MYVYMRLYDYVSCSIQYAYICLCRCTYTSCTHRSKDVCIRALNACIHYVYNDPDMYTNHPVDVCIRYVHINLKMYTYTLSMYVYIMYM